MVKKSLIIFVSSISLFLMSCSSRNPSPLFDGAYLKYEIDSDYLTIKFSQVNSKYFEVSLIVSDDNMLVSRFSKTKNKDGKVLVDKFMKRRNGKLLELKGIVGPVWVPENLRKKGSHVGVDLIFSPVETDEIKEWRDRQVYAVTASLFRGAVSGTWYYDMRSGFLVGCNAKTVISEFLSSGEDVPELILIGSNIKELGFLSQSRESEASKNLLVKNKRKVEENSGLSAIKIGGIMISGDESAVLIGDDVYKVGDIVEGVKIVDILSDSIQVLEKGKMR